MAADTPQLPPMRAEEIRSSLKEWMDRASIPGLSVAVFDSDTILYETGLGERNLESQAPATADTLYAVGSLTKPFTAVAVLQLVDRGKLTLEAEISQYLPVWTEAPGDPITVRELLSHSSGIPRDFVASRGSVEDGQDLDFLEYVDTAADQRLTDQPRYMYSNSGYHVLGELIEVVDGRSYTTYIYEELFEPLGMTQSTFDPAQLETDDDAMAGYHHTEDGLEPGTIDVGAGSAGGLISSVTELVPLCQCVLNDGTYDGERLLSAELADTMCQLQSPPLPSVNPPVAGYGYGWERQEFLGEPLVGHLGGIGIAGGYMGVLRDSGLGVAMAYNALGFPRSIVAKSVLARARGEDHDEAVPQLQYFDIMNLITGIYSGYRDVGTVAVEESLAGTITVDVEHRNLVFTATPDDVAGRTYRFSQVLGDGRKWLVEFDTAKSPVELILTLGKWTSRLTRDSPEQ